MASVLMLSFLIKAKFKRKLILETTLLACILLSCFEILVCHSVLPPPPNSCGDVLCIHGTCQDDLAGSGHCICDRGWQGSACHRCGGRIKLESNSGYITDGLSNYSTDLQCTWFIDSGTDDATIRLQFVDFETECSWDHLYVFDGDSVFSPLIAAYSGLIVKDGKKYQNIPEIIANSGKAYLYFYSDAAYNMSGFNVSYSINGCPKNCSAHGACIGRICTCFGHYHGDACDIPVCPNDCGIHGKCDPQRHVCVCEAGYKGEDCSVLESEGYWSAIETTTTLHGRSLHQAVVLNDSMYIVGGEMFATRHDFSFITKFDFRLRKWENIISSNKEPQGRFAHSLVHHNGKLYMYGGMLLNGTVANDMWRYDPVTSHWSFINFDKIFESCVSNTCSPLCCSPLSSMGHTATTVDNRMIVIFGHNPIYGYLNTVQEYIFSTRKWTMVKTTGAVVKGGYGHTSQYDHISKIIFIYGGYHSYGSDSILVDSLYGYNPFHKSWKLLNPSQSPRYLHSAVILNGMMLIYGGNGHNATHDNVGDKCFSPQFLAYEIECDSWRVLKDPSLSLMYSSDVGRYGHSAIVHDDAMYIFGGFNGLMLNSLLKYTPGDCSHYTAKEECYNAKPGVSCSWNEEKSSCQQLHHLKSSTTSIISFPISKSLNFRLDKEKCNQRSSNFTELCLKQSSCLNCLENSYGCVWCEDSCNYEKCKKTGSKRTNDHSRCSEQVTTSSCDRLHNCHACHTVDYCGWQRDHKCYTYLHDYGNNKTEKASVHSHLRPNCELPCHTRTSCENCTGGPCMWCSSSKRCIESNAYAAIFPIAQCSEWTIHSFKCSGLSCSDIQTCDRCQRNPRCGWCDDGSGTGVGVCLEGANRGPYLWNDSTYYLAENACPSRHWHFTACPECQCNGHSNCNPDSNTCQKPCQHLTEGSHCQYCVAGYYGNPVNGGNCTPCFCHNHSVFCQRETGKCHCTTKGITGHNCERCDEQNHYFGNPTQEGGSCYYNLTIDFQYTFNMSKPDDKYFTRINFMNVPSKPDVDVDFTISCSEKALVNISIGAAEFPINTLHEKLDCGVFKMRFSHDEHLFGVKNTTFYVNVFAFSTPFVLQISFSQHRTLDLLQFFVTFSSCFLTLLIIAAILWKIKQKYDMYRRRQQFFLELEHMASRPFAGIVVELDNEESTDPEEESFLPQKINNPTPISLEPCSNGKAAVLSLVVRLPNGQTGHSTAGQTGLAVASALVSLGTIDQKLCKENDIGHTNKIINSGKGNSPCGVTGV